MVRTSKYVVLVAGLAVLAAAAFVAFVAMRHGRVTPAPVVAANAANDKVIVVHGWSDKELQTIVADFCKAYQVPPAYRIGKQPLGLDGLRLSFPHDIEPELFFYLVNYITYPKNFDVANRAIGVLGRTTLSAAFNFPDPALTGRHAAVYVPAGDQEYDVVFVRMDSGEVFEHSFAQPQWKPVTDARMPALLESR